MTATAEDIKSDIKGGSAGRVVRITGPVVDVEFPRGSVPDLFNALNAEIAQMQVDMKSTSEDREIENKDFQETIADQRASQVILAKALARLEVFYAQKAIIQAKKQGQMPGAFTP